MEINEFIEHRTNKHTSKTPSGYFEKLTPPIINPGIQNFFLSYGASVLAPSSILVNKESFGVECIFGISKDPEYDLRAACRTYDKRIPKNQVPFAYMCGGDLLTLDLQTESLHICIHDKMDEYQLRNRKKPLPKFLDSYLDFFANITLTASSDEDVVISDAVAYKKVNGKWVEI
jgi:hypothetical protein